MELDVYTEKLYRSVIENESTMDRKTWCIWSLIDAKTIFNIVCQLFEYAKNAFVLRSYVNNYGLMDEEFAHESVSAHTNLVRAIMDRALSYLYGPELERNNIPGGFSYREIVEAISRHDLPENRIGDQPDNGSRDEEAKNKEEYKYHSEFSKQSPPHESNFEREVKELLLEMEESKTIIGKMLYLSDKVAALIITLAYDNIGKPPKMSINNPKASKRDLQEIACCDDKEGGACYASEMWAVDYFRGRKLIDKDIDGFFTAIVVMATLMVKHHWYSWRLDDYFEDCFKKTT